MYPVQYSTGTCTVQVHSGYYVHQNIILKYMYRYSTSIVYNYRSTTEYWTVPASCKQKTCVTLMTGLNISFRLLSRSDNHRKHFLHCESQTNRHIMAHMGRNNQNAVEHEFLLKYMQLPSFTITIKSVIVIYQIP